MDWTDEQLDYNYQCPHKESVRTRRTRSNGAVHHCLQCCLCFHELRSFKKVPGLETFPEFDEESLKAYQEAVRQRAKQKQAEWLAAKPSRQSWYRNDYLQSEHWKSLRYLVLRRDGYLCQCCLRNQATEVHHLNYDRVGQEIAWELMAVCRQCHEMLSPGDPTP